MISIQARVDFIADVFLRLLHKALRHPHEWEVIISSSSLPSLLLCCILFLSPSLLTSSLLFFASCSQALLPLPLTVLFLSTFLFSFPPFLFLPLSLSSSSTYTLALLFSPSSFFFLPNRLYADSAGTSIVPSSFATTTPYFEGSSTRVTIIVPSFPWALWNFSSSLIFQRWGKAEIADVLVLEGKFANDIWIKNKKWASIVQMLLGKGKRSRWIPVNVTQMYCLFVD